MLCIRMQTCSTPQQYARSQHLFTAHIKPLQKHVFPCSQALPHGRVIKAAAEKRETTVFGDLVDDDAQLQDIPEPGQQDFWEGEKWEWLGKLSFVLVPLLVLLAVLVGAFAAKTYDSGASTFLAP
ncbi:TPA: hypothetical protein ACH3X1_006698 [Trebouxia sp. C0004]